MKIKSKKKDALVPKKKKFEKRKVLAVMMILVATVLTFVVVPAIYNHKGSTEEVYVANSLIEKGSIITDKMLTTKEIGVYGMKDYYTAEDIKKIKGEIASVDIPAGDILTKAKLGGVASETIASVTKDGHTLMALPIPNIASGVGSHLRSGDYVRIWQKIEDENGDEKMYLDPLLSKIKVFSAENGEGKETAKATESGEETNASVVTFELTSPEQSIALAKVVLTELHLEIVEREE